MPDLQLILPFITALALIVIINLALVLIEPPEPAWVAQRPRKRS